MASSEPGTRPATNIWVAYGFGAAYLVVGLVGFALTSSLGFIDRPGRTLLFFEVNPLHNVVHVLIGGLLAAGACGGLMTARRVNALVGAGYLVVGALGMFLLDSPLDVLALNWGDNLLHLGSAAVLLAVGLRADLDAPLPLVTRPRAVR